MDKQSLGGLRSAKLKLKHWKTCFYRAQRRILRSEGVWELAGGCPKSRKIALSPIKTKITRVVGCRELVESCRGHFEHFWGPPKCSKPP